MTIMSSTAVTDSVLVETHDSGVVVLTINRPSRRNAFDLATAVHLSTALDAFDADPDARVAILMGTGNFFSAGMDLKAFGETGERPVDESRGAFGIVQRPPLKPVIAAVEGAALGGGFEIALACDLVVAAIDAVFGLPEVKRGLTAAGGGLLRLPERIPYHIAMQAALTGESMTASRCSQLGLVNVVTESGGTLDAALILAEQIAANGPLAVQASKRVITEAKSWPPKERFTLQEPIVDAIRQSADAREGAAAFLAKRLPQWRGQ